jgi:hypothetical protein
MLDAWRNLDGTYTLKPRRYIPSGVDMGGVAAMWYGYSEITREQILKAGGREITGTYHWIVPESALQPLGASRTFIVIIAGYCCAPVARAEAMEHHLKQGQVYRVYCPTCRKRSPTSTLWEVPIVEICGEGEEGQRTYEAAFLAEIEGR